MINVFYRNRNTIGQFMVALIFLGTFGFLFTFDGFTAKSEAKSCCGGEAAVTTFAADSSGDFGSDIPMDAEPIGGCCDKEDKVIPSSSNNNDEDTGCTCLDGNYCDECDTSDCGGTHERYCATGCPESQEDGCYCTLKDCDKTDKEACSSPCYA